MLCTKNGCSFDSGGSREALARHNAEVHGGKSSLIGFEQPKVEQKFKELYPLAKVDEERAVLLGSNGYDTMEKIATASIEELRAFEGIGKATARAIIESAKELTGEEDAGDSEGFVETY